nr:hypothetical protein [uncultured Mediterranean phage uvMED]
MSVYKALGKAAVDLGQQTLKGFAKKGYTKDLAPQVVKSLSNHINITKGVDIPEMETMFKGMKAGDEVAYESFNDFSKTLSAADQYQSNVAEMTRTIRRPQQGVIKGPSARKILGNQQLTTPKTARSESIPPNLPQNIIDEYTQESSARLRAGEKNRVDVPYLVDADDRVYRLDQKGWEYDGDIKQKKYALIDVDLKRARNAKLDKIRQQKVNLTTRAGTDQKDFYADPDPKARHKKGIEEPHHRAPLHPSARLKSGLSKREGSMLDNFLESKGIVTGNSKYNRDNLPNEVHKKLHSWLKKNKLLTGNEDLTDLTLAQRKKYINQFVADMQKSDAKTFKIMQAFNRLTKRKTK